MALEMRCVCERCGGALRPDDEAYICSFQNCNGELVARARRVVA